MEGKFGVDIDLLSYVRMAIAFKNIGHIVAFDCKEQGTHPTKYSFT